MGIGNYNRHVREAGFKGRLRNSSIGDLNEVVGLIFDSQCLADRTIRRAGWSTPCKRAFQIPYGRAPRENGFNDADTISIRS